MNIDHLIKKPLSTITRENYHQMMADLARMSGPHEYACTCGNGLTEGESVDQAMAILGSPMIGVILSIAYYINGDGRKDHTFVIHETVERCAPVRTVIEIIDEFVRVGAISVTKLSPPKG